MSALEQSSLHPHLNTINKSQTPGRQTASSSTSVHTLESATRLLQSYVAFESLKNQLAIARRMADMQSRQHAAVLLVDADERARVSQILRATLKHLTELERSVHKAQLELIGTSGLHTPLSPASPFLPASTQYQHQSGCSFRLPLCPMAVLARFHHDLGLCSIEALLMMR